MAAYNKFQSFVEHIAEGVHNLETGTLTVALCAAANAPVATNTVLANLTQVSSTGPLPGRRYGQGAGSLVVQVAAFGTDGV